MPRKKSTTSKAVSASNRPKRLSTVIMLAVTGLLLTALFPPFYCFFLAPVALVPLCVCILRRPLRIGYLAAYYALGCVFFAGNLFWLGPVTVGGFIALALFLALYFPLFALGLHRLVNHLRVPAIIAVPLVWTAMEYLRSSFVLGGFPWFLLGNCLTPAPVLIQAADLVGVWGLSFLVAMLNGFVVDVLRLPLKQQGKFNPVIGRLTATAAIIVAFIFGYGFFRLDEKTTTPGPRIAVIQENIPQSLKEQPGASVDVFLRHLRLSDQAAEQRPKPDLIVWPETMVPWPINDEFAHAKPEVFKSFGLTAEEIAAMEGRSQEALETLQERVDETKIPLLVGYGAVIPQTDWSVSIKQNRTVLLLPRIAAVPASRGGLVAAGAARWIDEPRTEYSKIHIVPFGEFIPFRGVPVVANLMRFFSPVDYDYSLTPGEVWTRFTLPVVERDTEEFGTTSRAATTAATQFDQSITTMTRFYTFGTPICYEDTMPEPARQMSAPQFAAGGGGRKADFLLNVSNDGWFQWVELDQHLQACQLRAVENRIAIARSVNTGNSGFIDSDGRIVDLVRDASGNSIGAVGTLAQTIMIDSRVTLYSRIGDLFPILCGVVSTLLVGWTFVRPRRSFG